MPTRNIIANTGWILFLLLALCWGGGYASAADALTIGRMRVAIWPEYDDPGVLVVYDGRFVDSQAFPTKTRFIVPKGIVINDACSLSPEGQHFCQLFKLDTKEKWDELELWLPFANFYLSFHLPTVPRTKDGQNALDYMIKANHPIEQLELDFQQPLRSTAFTIEPAGGETLSREPFTHFRYLIDRIAKGDEKNFKIRYQKTDPNPSVDIKFTAMTGEKVFGSPYDTQKRVSVMVYVLFGSGLTILLLYMAWWLRRKQDPTP